MEQRSEGPGCRLAAQTVKSAHHYHAYAIKRLVETTTKEEGTGRLVSCAPKRRNLKKTNTVRGEGERTADVQAKATSLAASPVSDCCVYLRSVRVAAA